MTKETLEKATSLKHIIYVLERELGNWREHKIGRCQTNEFGASCRKDLELSYVPKEIVEGFRQSVIAAMEAGLAKANKELETL